MTAKAKKLETVERERERVYFNKIDEGGNTFISDGIKGKLL